MGETDTQNGTKGGECNVRSSDLLGGIGMDERKIKYASFVAVCRSRGIPVLTMREWVLNGCPTGAEFIRQCQIDSERRMEEWRRESGWV